MPPLVENIGAGDVGQADAHSQFGVVPDPGIVFWTDTKQPIPARAGRAVGFVLIGKTVTHAQEPVRSQLKACAQIVTVEVAIALVHHAGIQPHDRSFRVVVEDDVDDASDRVGTVLS